MKKILAASPKRTNDPQGMRRRLLDVAAEAFQSGGYQSTGMGDILQAAGVTGGAMYHHFPSKKALGLAVIRERVALEIECTWVAPMAAARSTVAGIKSIFKGIIAGLDERAAVIGCPLSNLTLELALADPEFRLASQEIFRSWRNAIAQKIRADHAAGVAKHLDPDAFAIMAVATFSGAMAMAKAEQNTVPLKACLQQLLKAM